MLWRSQGASDARLTILVKATFALVREGVVTPHAPDALVLHDIHHAGDPRFSLAAASDLAPYRAGAEVLVVGHAYAPPGKPATSAGARLVLHREGQVLVQKTIDIHGERRIDRTGRTTDPAPFQRMPLVYERAVLEPETNPVGLDPARGHAPNLVDPRDPARPACFGPLAPTWPCRSKWLRGLDPRNASGARLELPPQVSFDYFYAAPPDQRTTFLRGDESIQLGGMHPVLPILRTRLPGIRARACVYRGASVGQPLDLFADTLLIDTDRQVCSLVFRSNVAVTDAELPTLVVAAGLEQHGTPIDFPDRLPTMTTTHPAVMPDSDDDEDLAETRTLVRSSPSTRTPPRKTPDASAEDDEERFAATLMLDQGSSTKGPALPFTPNPRIAATPPPLLPTPPAPPKRVKSEEENLGETQDLTALASAVKRASLPFASAAAPPNPIVEAPAKQPLVAPPRQAEPDDEERLAGTYILPRGGLPVAREPALPFVPGSGAAALPPPLPQAPRIVDAEDEEPWSGTLHLTAEAQQSRGPVLPFITAPPLPPPPDAPPPPPEIPRRSGDTIPTFGEARLAVVTSPWQVRPPRDSITVIVKATCAIVPGGAAELLPEPDLPTGDIHHDDDPQKGLLHASDIAIFKPKADVTLAGRAYAPGGKGTACEVSFRFGRGKNAFARRLAVFGDRHWEKGLVTLAPTAPRSFDSIPLGWERAYGGSGFDDNPLGTGHGAAEGPDGMARLPHIEDPERLIKGPSDSPRPAGLGPIPALWKQRWSKLGTYDARWLQRRWPYFPEDFDWAYFQAAPAGQQLDHLAGDEPFDIRGMRKDHPRLEGTLPAMRARCFYQRTEEAGGQFGEVRLVLDTVHFDVEAMKIQLVWRGLLEVEDDDAPEIAALFAFAESLADPSAALPDAREAFLEALRAENEENAEEEPTESEAEGTEAPPAPEKDPDEAAAEAKLAELLAEAERRSAKITQEMRAAGIEGLASPPASPPDPAHVLEALRKAGATEEQVAEMAALFAPEPANDQVQPEPALRARVIAMLASEEPFDRMELEGADLSGLDFSDRSLVGVDLRGAKLRGCRFVAANLTEALLSGSDLAGAVLDGAELQAADLTDACIENATLKGAKVDGADLSNARGARARLDGIRGEGALFAGGTWDGARFDGALLPKADFTGASISNAVFNGADLSDVTLYDARGASVLFEEARMKDARCDGAELSRAKFRKTNAAGSTWENAKLDETSFLGANLSSSNFARASCRRGSFSGADLREANLRRAKLEKTAFLGANLMEAILERADLSGADLRKCNLHGAETWKAKLDGANLDFAIVTQTKLGRRA
ncbi:DUF2169 family type VI secretion system accessory protein [Polyangium mundeleinium]|uniref:DUF2169 domain-containing protein n=1 Tax=Polyangium mundeleinium TaxID=2995306 RepID=A0ABT5EIG5_9BACT|nr:DUF2169 domain-containing protein [Polyangium mundeleinium]MDC0741598.1 DUF2169 domain-containing protein [Polyangium mundeleinium]